MRGRGWWVGHLGAVPAILVGLLVLHGLSATTGSRSDDADPVSITFVGSTGARAPGDHPPRSTTVPRGGPQLDQAVSIGVRPGGPLSVQPAEQIVDVTGAGTLFRSVVDASVVDPRGSLAGWQLEVAVEAPAGTRVRVAASADAPDVHTTGNLLVSSSPVTAAIAAPGGGGGTTEIQLHLQVVYTRVGGEAPSIRVRLSVS